jgi:hypothetical protein
MAGFEFLGFGNPHMYTTVRIGKELELTPAGANVLVVVF